MTETVPDGWKAVAIGDLVRVLGGYAFKSADFTDSGSPVIRISNLNVNSIDLSDCARISEEKLGKGSRFKIEPGDTLIAMSGATTGKLGFVPDDLSEDCYLNQRVGAFRIPVDSPLNRSYFRLLLGTKFYQAHVWNLAGGAAQPNISGKQLESAIIPLPPLADQKRIAGILDAADALRAKRRESLAQLDNLLQSTFLDLFGDPVTNPMGWEVKPLGELGTLDRGVSKHRPRNEPSLLGGSHPLIQTGEVANSDGYIRLYTSTYSDLGLKQSKMWPAGTLCITIAANIANTGILTFDACFPDSVVGFKSDERGRVEYVQGLFWFFKEILNRRAPQVAQKNINLKILRGLPVPLPPANQQHRFAAIVESVERQKARLRTHLAELDALFASLQSRAFDGEL